MTALQDIFDDIYRRRQWGHGSGGGSDPSHAADYCRFVSAFIAEHRPKVVLDIGCGDGRLFSAIDWGEARYVGMDAAKSMSGGRVICGDALVDELPDADLMLCKEVTQHLSNGDVLTLLGRTAKYRTRLFTSRLLGHPNVDIETGGFRSVDLSLEPFNQPCETVLEYGSDAHRWIVQMI